MFTLREENGNYSRKIRKGYKDSFAQITAEGASSVSRWCFRFPTFPSRTRF